MGARRRGSGGSRLLTIMFTDIEGSTALTQRLGDARAQELVRVHNQLARREIATRGGREIKHTGDGVMATFASASSAVAAATSLQRAVRAHNDANPESHLVINVGLNAGEPLSEDADVFGSAVQLAARACAAAEGGQVLATNVVRELVQGKGVLFSDQGFAELKGFEEPVRLFGVFGEEGEWVDDAGEHGRKRSTLAWVGVVAAVVVVAGIVAIVASRRSGDSVATASLPAAADPASATDATLVEYTERGTTEVVSVTGDCATEDTHVAGVIEQQARGGLVGVVRTEYDATIELARECQGMHLAADATYNLNDGSFASHSEGFSIQTLGDHVSTSRFSSTMAIGFVNEGTGRYEGVTGVNICRSDSLRNENELTNTSECEAWLYAPDQRPDFVVAAIVDSEEVATNVAAGAASSPVRCMIAVKNTSGGAVDGAVLSLRASEGAQIRAASVDGRRAVTDLSWDIGSLAPDEELWIELLIAVSQAQGELVLTPEISAGGTTTVGLPATVRVRD